MSVYFEADRNKFRVLAKVSGKWKHVGRYDTELKAKRAYNRFLKSIEPVEVGGLDSIKPKYEEIQPVEQGHFEFDLPIGDTGVREPAAKKERWFNRFPRHLKRG